MKDLTLGLIPALGWGIQSIVMQKIGGKFTNKVMGMATGSVIFALVIVCFHQPRVINADLIIGSVLSGVFWCVGQLLQVRSFDLLGVSTAMPLSTGEQLVGTVLFGIFYFHEWTRSTQYMIGIVAIVVIVLGAILISTISNGAGRVSARSARLGFGVVSLSSLGLIGYAVIPRMFHLNGWDMLLPQAIAMWVSMAIIVSRVKDNQMWNRKSWQNIATGMCFAIANLAILLSNEVNGLAVGYTLSQLNVVVATLGGLFILHERLAGNRYGRLIAGLTLIVLGAVFIGMTK